MGADPYRYFRIEARELLDGLGAGALELERGAPPPELVPRLLRLAHTLKGAARVVRAGAIADDAHALEDALAPLRGASQAPERAIVDAILALCDRMRRRLAELDTPAEVAAPPAEAPAPAPAFASAPVSSPAEPFHAIRADVSELDELLGGLTEAHRQANGLRREQVTLERALRLAELLTGQLASPRAASARLRPVAEELRELCAAAGRGLSRGLEQLDRELRAARDGAERLRLLPAAELVPTLARTARDAAHARRTRVDFDASGVELRLESQVLGVVQAALVQMVRNAVAHGIEAEAERRAAGKPPAGRVRLEVSRRGRRVVFACSDDGRGIDVEAVRREARRRGLADSVTDASKETLIRLLLDGGISTSESVTELAGRGVGFDVIREAAQQLGGEVAVHSQAGTGTTVELAVPQSLAALEAVVVDAGEESAVLPLGAVRGALRLQPGAIVRGADSVTLLHEGAPIPYVELAALLAPARASTRSRAPAASAVVIAAAEGPVALGVTRLLGTASVVVKPLPRLAPAGPAIAGACLDGAGRAQLVLDPDGVARLARQLRPPSAEAAPPPLVLVIDDSLTTRMLEQSILESAGYRVDVATSAEEGLAMARAKAYALFLVDVEMPGMDGFEFVARTRADAALREVPAILVTSRDAPEDQRRGREVGAADYVVKSAFSQRELLDRIGELVQR